MHRAALLTFAIVACSPAAPTETIVLTPLPPSPSASAAPTTMHVHLRPLAASEADRDGDSIPDDLDKCPDEPETFNHYQDEDGCPDVAPTAKP